MKNLGSFLYLSSAGLIAISQSAYSETGDSLATRKAMLREQFNTQAQKNPFQIEKRLHNFKDIRTYFETISSPEKATKPEPSIPLPPQAPAQPDLHLSLDHLAPLESQGREEIPPAPRNPDPSRAKNVRFNLPLESIEPIERKPAPSAPANLFQFSGKALLKAKQPAVPVGPIQREFETDHLLINLAGRKKKDERKAIIDGWENHKDRFQKQPYLDIVRYLGLDRLYLLKLSGKHTKVAIMDNWFDYNAENLDSALSKSTRQKAPKHGKGKTVNEGNMFRGPSKHHGNHVTSIFHQIAPKSKIRFINFQAESYAANGGVPELNYTQGLESAIHSKVHFINFSMKFPGIEHQDDTIKPAFRDALLQLAAHKIGIIMALGNDHASSTENRYVRSLIELADTPEMKGRMLVVVASQNVDGQDGFADFSNYPAGEKESRHVIAAPGVGILAMGAGGIPLIKDGTSQATPCVTGVAALIRQHLQNTLNSKEIMPEIVFEVLLQSARQKSLKETQILDYRFGNGIINPLGAYKLVLSKSAEIKDANERAMAE